MLDLAEPWIAELPAALRRLLAACAQGEIPANIAAMQLLIEARDPAEAEMAVTALLSRLNRPVHGPGAQRLRAVLEVLRANPQAWAIVKAVLGNVRHDSTATNPEEQVARLAAAFDRAAQASAEGSVALYSLGNPELLRAATAEVVERMREWGLLGRERTALDLGCGIGRFGEALAGELKSLIGSDISAEMVRIAQSRCAGLGNVSFVQSSGRDLSLFRTGSFDLVLAADSFPYFVQSGMSLVETHFAEAARVLRPRGDLLILNFSYRGDPAQDRTDIRRLASAFGFDVLRDGTREFTLWDGLAFHLVRD